MNKTKSLTVDDVLKNPRCPEWVKAALREAIKRDPMTASNEADMLADVLRRRYVELGD